MRPNSTAALHVFLKLLTAGSSSVVAAWKQSQFPLSLASAYRWIKVFERQMPHFRPTPFRIHNTSPPEDSSQTPLSLTLRAFEDTSNSEPLVRSYGNEVKNADQEFLSCFPHLRGDVPFIELRRNTGDEFSPPAWGFLRFLGV